MTNIKNETAGKTAMQVFNFNRKNGTPVRVQVINGEPWFVAKDVCHILDISNHIDAVSRLDEDERMDEGVSKFRCTLWLYFCKQSPDFHKPGLCHVAKFLYLCDIQ